MLKIGVLGAGHLGKIHIKCIKMIENYQLIGFYDPNDEIAKKVSEEFQIKKFASLQELIDAVDVVDIVTPTVAHYKCAEQAVSNKKHIFIEKPITTTIDEARQLITQAQQAKVKAQIGHVERFNPAYIAADPYLSNPLFIETHRLAQFNPRGTDVPVVLDLMIHDIDILLHAVKADIENISASGVQVISNTPDIANARIEFSNGCIANLTASRISLKNMRKSRFFQRDAYISVDFLDKCTEVVRLQDPDPDMSFPFALTIDVGDGRGKKQIISEKPKIEPINAIKTELESFYNAIVNNTTPVVTINDGYNALNVAYRIMEKIEEGLTKYKPYINT